MSSLQKSVLKSTLAGYALPPRNPASSGFGRKPKDFSPVHWSKYFARKENVPVNSDSFCTYFISSTTNYGIPVILLLHGGGFSGLTWSAMAQRLDSFIHAQIIAIDLRGHGETVTGNDDDLSADTLSTDIVNIITMLKLQDNPIIIVGHSLGGALAVHATQKIYDMQEFKVLAVIVIDVVEGSAIESLSTMHSILKQRPKSFTTLSRAIEWSMKSGVIKDNDSARVSMPGQLKVKSTDEPGTFHVTNPNASSSTTLDSNVSSCDKAEDALTGSTDEDKIPVLRSDAIMEEEEGDEPSASPLDKVSPVEFPTPSATSTDNYTWRIDLHKTEPYWQGWFKGMSLKFLSLACPKLLMLAGVDRLDRDLTVGQMQRKFQMHVIPNVGHAVHEDSPEEVAQCISSFLIRHKLVDVGSIDFSPVFPGC